MTNESLHHNKLNQSPGALTAEYPEAVNRAFSKQSAHYDNADRANPVLTGLRKQVYEHVAAFMKPGSKILELNAGTGIDAMYFAQLGHEVLTTDVSDGMVARIREKITAHGLQHRVSCRQLSYEELHLLAGDKFDYVFSNFGGLNCIDDLSRVSRHLAPLLDAGAHLTWVVMPPVCPWELAGLLKGHGASALRRFRKGGTMAHVEGEYFRTYYHSLADVQTSLGTSFKLLKSEGLAALSPPPYSAHIAERRPGIYAFLRRVDRLVRYSFPFDRWADHIVVTFRYEDGNVV